MKESEQWTNQNWEAEISRNFLIFLILSVLLGIVSAVESSSLANRLYEDLDFKIMQRLYWRREGNSRDADGLFDRRPPMGWGTSHLGGRQYTGRDRIRLLRKFGQS